MKRKDILQRLEERLARGEISEKTYLDIKARYDAEPEPREAPEPAAPDLEASIHAAVASAAEAASRLTMEAVRASADAVRAVNFTGMGVRLSDQEIRILGSGIVTGDPVKTETFRVDGSGRVRGSLECDDARIAGSCDFDGDLQCSDFRSSGSSRIAGSLRAQDVSTSGSLEVAKDVEAADIAASGAFRVDGNVHGRDFHSSGAVRIHGVLQVTDVDIELGGSSQIGAIEGQDIRVRMTGGFSRSRGDLTADRIVGRDVDIEGTMAAFVQGRDVRIGPHCRVEKVVAQDLVVHESSEVKERQVPARSAASEQRP